MSTTHLIKGQNARLADTDLTVTIDITAAADLCALLVTADGSVRSDDDFVFFNQPSAPGVRLRPGTAGRSEHLALSLGALPAEIDRVRVVVSMDGAGATFGASGPLHAHITDSSDSRCHSFRIEGLDTESVVIAVEMYRHASGWKVRAVGQGYAGGLAALATDHGITVDETPATTPVPDTPPRIPAAGRAGHELGRDIRAVRGEEQLSFEKRQQLDLRKRAVAKVLLDKGAVGVRARVVLVIDKTGSMRRLYSGGTVQRIVERMIPVAVQLDDDGKLEPYLYAVDYARLPDVTIDKADAWCAEFLHLRGHHGGIDYGELGGSNNELPIMREVIASVARHREPTLILFFTDGGFREKSKIGALLREASALPAFWQFIGLGQAEYGVLRNLDTMTGRRVDNAGFFAVDDIDAVTDTDLYNRLLGEFPDWLRAARAAGITR
ncbi:vWA domain-containing protein [Nocardia sp. NPDC003345]